MPLGTGIQWGRITEAWEYRPTDWLNMQWIVEISRINNRNNTLLTYRQMVRCGFWNRQAASSTIHFNTISSAAVTYSWRSHTHCARSGILACVRSFVYFSDSNISKTIQKWKCDQHFTIYYEKKIQSLFSFIPKQHLYEVSVCVLLTATVASESEQKNENEMENKLKVTIESMKGISVWAATATAITFENGKKRPQRAADAKLFYFGLILQHILSVSNSSVGWFKIVRL